MIGIRRLSNKKFSSHVLSRVRTFLASSYCRNDWNLCRQYWNYHTFLLSNEQILLRTLINSWFWYLLRFVWNSLDLINFIIVGNQNFFDSFSLNFDWTINRWFSNRNMNLICDWSWDLFLQNWGYFYVRSIVSLLVVTTLRAHWMLWSFCI